jgi:hypothetical protein
MPHRLLLLLAAIFALSVQQVAAQASLSERVWDDPARFRALAERTVPWPLRDYPAPPGTGFPERCGSDPRTQIRLRPHRVGFSAPPHTWLWVRPFGVQISNGDTRSFQHWVFNRLRTGRACPGDQAFDAQSFTIYLAEGLPTGLDARCHAPGLPPDTRPECDWPRSLRFHLTFVLGLPHLIQITAPDARYTDGQIVDGIHRAALSDPGLEEQRTRRGNTLLVGRGHTRVYGTVMPRIGDPADTSEPLFTDCTFEWTPPDPGELRRIWNECGVRFRFRGVMDVTYRFYREIFDEPDVPGLDLRVRDYLRALLLPPSTSR